MAIALGTGISGYLFSDEPTAAYAHVTLPEQPGANSSQQVLSRVLKPWTSAEPVAPAAAVSPMPDEQPAAEATPQVIERAISPAAAQASPTPDAASEGTVRASREVAPGTTDLVVGDRVRVTLSFYYCEEVSGGFPAGDGGGFCGRGRDGSVVRSGMAACDVAYLGQKFQIVGDPTGRTYVCADTGSAVHGLHRDIWFLDNRSGWGWQSQVGASAMIEVMP
jgi:hypothetical protein